MRYKEHIKSLFKNNHVHRIFGTAGSGKTTFLMNILDELFQQDVEPQRIAFVSFTNKAVNEIIERSTAKFKQFTPQQFIHFNTIHSMAYKTINNEKKAVIQHPELIQLAKSIGMEVSTYRSIEDGAGSKKGDKVINIESLARLKMITLEDQWRESNEKDCPLFLVNQWRKVLDDYKKENDLIDFTDMLEQYNSSLNVDYVFIDEAQDLCPLQWKVMDQASTNAKKVFIAGDDDQSIFNWAGAIVDYFLDMKADEETILQHSYRLPSDIYMLSRRILSRIKKRKPKESAPVSKRGKIEKLFSFENLDIKRNEEYLILVRNRWQMREVEALLRKNGHVYYLFTKNSIDTDEVLAIQYWKEFQKTGKIEKRQYRKMQKYSQLLTDYTIDELNKDLLDYHWCRILHNLQQEKSIYLQQVEAYHDFNQIPKIKVSTIHQAKGGEADNVVLFTDVSYNVWNNRFTDSEHKVWYVAITRSKKNLYIIKEQGLKYYCI